MLERKEENEIKNNLIPENRICSPQGRYIRLDERLGSGAYKDVWRAYDTNEGFEVAWNVIKLNRVPPNERKRIKTEVKLLKDLEHPNVIKYHNSWVNREKEEIVFVTEIMSSGSLKDYIKKNPMIRWNAVKRWCVQILRGLEFLHSKQIIHRDIKCDNIFINGSTGDIRIGDLGLSTKIAEGNVLPPGTADKGEIRQITAAAMTCLGTPEFMAPELYDENYNEKVDIYAFGMSCLEMVTALTPYHDCTSAAQIYKKVINGELPPELSLVRLNSARKFIEACLLPGINRPSATELLSYEFLSPNEEDDFLEVRVRLESVPEALSSPGSEDDEDNSDEETSISYQLRETNQIISNNSTPSISTSNSITASPNQNLNNNPNNNLIFDESMIKSTELKNDQISSIDTENNQHLGRPKAYSDRLTENFERDGNLDKPTITRTKTADGIIVDKSLNQEHNNNNNQQQSQQQLNNLKENNHLHVSNSPEKIISDNVNIVIPKTPPSINLNQEVLNNNQNFPSLDSDVILTEEIPLDDNQTFHKRRSSGSGNGSGLICQEFRKTSSRVLRVCLSDSGHRGRSSSFIDIPLSPMSQDLTYDQYSVLPSSSIKNIDNNSLVSSSQNIGVNLTQEFQNSSTDMIDNGNQNKNNLNLINSNNNNAINNIHKNNNEVNQNNIINHINNSNINHSQNNIDNNNNLTTSINNQNINDNNIDTYSLPKYSEENFLGVVDVGDKGLDLNGTMNENCLIFRLRVPFENTFKEIEFEFDLLRDNPQSIVDEMNEVDELMFLSAYAKQIVDSLTPIVEVGQRVLKEKTEKSTDKSTLSNLVLEEFLATAEQYDDRALAALSASRVKSDPLVIPMEPKLELPPQSQQTQLQQPQSQQTQQPQQIPQQTPQQPQILTQPQPQRLSSHNNPIQLNLPEIKSNSTQNDDHLFQKPSKLPSRSSFPSSNSSDNYEKGINSVSSTPSSSYILEKTLNTSPTKISTSEYEPSLSSASQGHHELSIGSSQRNGINDVSLQEDNTQKILDDNDPEYQLLYTKYLESVTKIEKEHNHLKTNISSQKDKIVENYRREYEKLVNRQNDLNKQLINMEERFKERMSDFSQRKQQLYLDYINKHPKKNRNIT